MEWAWLIPVFSFAAAPAVVIFGKYLPGKGSWLSILAIGGGFVVFWLVLDSWLDAHTGTIGCFTSENTSLLTCDYERSWFNAGIVGAVGSVSLNWGILIDPLTIAMLGLVTFVALMVQVYSLSYMKDDPRFGWYFAVHSLFAAAMLTLVLADNFLLLYVAWELVGICSYLLIGFWHERQAAREAAKKAFIVTRIGDVGLLVGILLIWRDVGSFSMLDAFEAVRTGAMSEGVATASAILLFLGAMGKSAQVPFHVWLPDAMEGPTPVSALIHAATMVVAGVYLVARTFPLFEAYDADPLLLVSIVGLVTALGASTIALVATDLKRILAYSTISHLGLMMLSLGAFGYTAAIFHMMAHGFSKALLFLGAGSVLHSTEFQETGEMGGLRKVMPVTAIVFSIGALSLGGIPILAGFWSKDEILVAVNDHRNVTFIALTLFTAFLSALYMGRAMFLVFFGPLKDQNNHVHDAPIAMALPMALLGVLALGFGLISFNWPGSFGGFGTFVFFGHGEPFHFEVWLGALSIIMAVAAFVAAYKIYALRSVSLQGLRSRNSGLLKIVENKYYFDEVYQWTIDRVVLVFSRFIAYFDRAIVNDIIVNGPADVTRKFGIMIRVHVTGHVYSYAMAMALGSVGLGIFVWLRVA
ncbi:uncharacterized protein METZ01_LOCUS4241 [marine metagenome]|uniref:NADH:quinone oxidoreductase/Mrp antiporter membrane subunit domain-containing protein n=1 Tax=marine metagenome TaxID=408172 RepID=A0A381NA59_9ZZZZ